MSLKLTADDSGRILKHTQVDNYYYRDPLLSHINYFDFVQFFRLEKQKHLHHSKNGNPRLGTFRRYSLKEAHPLSKTHEIVEHTNVELGHGSQILVPHVVGLSIPRPQHSSFHLFMLAHFKPFSSDFPLIEKNKTVQSTFNDFSFSEKSKLIMKNWEAIYECEDERDADRLCKRAALAKESQALTRSMAFENGDDLIDVSSEQMTAKKDFEVNSILLKLLESNWLKKVDEYSVPIQTEKVKTLEIPDLTKSLLQTWKNEMKSQEEVILTRRRNAQDTSNQIGAQEIPETEIGTNAIPTLNNSTSVKETENLTDQDVPFETREELLNRIIQEETLNRKQTIAFRIIANSFLSSWMIEKME